MSSLAYFQVVALDHHSDLTGYELIFLREGYELISYYSSNTALYMTKAPLIQLQIMEHELLSPEIAKKKPCDKIM